MQTIEHAIAMTRPKGMTPRRLTGFVFAGLLQVALIFALINGLNIKVWPEPTPGTTVEIVRSHAKPGLPPPSVPNWREPAATKPIMPVFTIDTGRQGQGITMIQRPAGVSYDRPALGMAETHTIPPYPPLEARLGVEGNVWLHLTISPQGVVTDATITRSSGDEGLDRAARNWIMAHWRYRPALQGGVPAAGASDVEVQFNLKNAR
ncbi:MAG: energy transducer TonB [Alphaproteobacteria bacterium]|nr:energy transducer TonB [Alphaproteobacteria bacterium]